jgi:DNA polymerase bacteriophage-type
MPILHIDIETYSSVDLKSSGVYKYAEAHDFEILMVAYALGKEPVRCYNWADLPLDFFQMLQDPTITKVAHNAAFERVCFTAMGQSTEVSQWRCTAVKSAYCGLPMSLKDVSAALALGDKAKSSAGAALIRYFSMPVKATRVNGGRTRNKQEHNPEKWQQFMDYCAQDVEAEREITRRLAGINVPQSEWDLWHLDQRINDRGVRLDLDMAIAAIQADEYSSDIAQRRLKELTGLDNPNSLAQLRSWITARTGNKVLSLAKEPARHLQEHTTDATVREVLTLREQTGKTSIKKYTAMLACACEDERARGLFQFYGAGRTGRWAGRLIQLQNLPRNYMRDLAEARHLLKSSTAEVFGLVYDTPDALSQLIRTALVPSEGRVFAVADYSAIEARVLAWLADERWRLEVFASHGKIYEASASRMFNVPMEQIGKGSELRQKGKVAELALGYQGSVGALKTMGGERMGLDEQDMSVIVEKWRAANPRIVKFWHDLESLMRKALESRATTSHPCGLRFKPTKDALHLQLPSGRELVYWSAEVAPGPYGKSRIRYKGTDSVSRQFTWLDTYGGKLTENVVQAISRDLLAHGLIALESQGYATVMHVHDEVVVEVFDDHEAEELKEVESLISAAPDWAKGLPLGADGYCCQFYMKD